jgi:hypothetical protein
VPVPLYLQGGGALVAGAVPFSTGEVVHMDGGFHLRRFL